jgi:acetoin utilization deacetylase AcuC-like enzyme
MIRIRRISNPYLEVNIRKLEKVKEIIKVQIPLLSSKKIDEIELQMVDTLKYNYQTILFIAEDIDESVKGLAILLHMPDLQYCYLDYLAVAPGKAPSGLGGALYGRVREEAEALEAFGVFFECLPDDPELCLDKGLILQNQKRLAFYERFGARPIVNTLYESTVNEDEDSPPYLVFDGLGIRNTIPKQRAREIVESILVRKYADYCPESYIEKVVNSIQDDPVTMRPPRYTRTKINSIVKEHQNKKDKILLIVNDKHFIHHIRERGYVESPVRVESIRKELDKTGMFRYGDVSEYPEKLILSVHDKNYFNYFKKVCENLPKGKSVYPYVFPLRNSAKAPKELAVRAGYYCFDTFTPLNKNAFLAARWGVNCTLTATDELIASNYRAAYVLTRPPGHHAEKSVFGGFCYFNNCAIAANRLSKIGKVAILDIDYHHGNGQQQIFYKRNDVLTISIHGHPSIAYPYFSGFAKEKGEELGLGFNTNFPLPEKITYETYSTILNKALKLIQNFKADYLIVALGLDTAKGDPTGTWDFTFENFLTTGKLIGILKIPTLIVQEGGYRNQSLGSNARAFFNGFYHSNSNKVKTE